MKKQISFIGGLIGKFMKFSGGLISHMLPTASEEKCKRIREEYEKLVDSCSKSPYNKTSNNTEGRFYEFSIEGASPFNPGVQEK